MHKDRMPSGWNHEAGFASFAVGDDRTWDFKRIIDPKRKYLKHEAGVVIICPNHFNSHWYHGLIRKEDNTRYSITFRQMDKAPN